MSAAACVACEARSHFPSPFDSAECVCSVPRPGRGGTTIQRIQSSTGTHIQIAPDADFDNPNMRSAVVTGSMEGVLQAQEQIVIAMEGNHRTGINASMPVTVGGVPNPAKRFRYHSTRT